MSVCILSGSAWFYVIYLQDTLAMHDTKFIDKECKKRQSKIFVYRSFTKIFKYHATKSKELKVLVLYSVTHRVYSVT